MNPNTPGIPSDEEWAEAVAVDPRPWVGSAEKRRLKRLEIAERDGARCFYCRKPADPETLTLDHWIPKSIYDCSRTRNLRLACEPCNTAKADALPLALVWLLLRYAADPALYAPAA